MDEAFRRFPGGTYAIWYPLSGRVPAADYLGYLKSLGKPCFTTELALAGAGTGIAGCGVVTVNPPWKVDDEARAIVGYLATVLCLGQEAQGSVRWLVPK
jgi:23S rRNA (adenine2030-N6)-methyltransferase